MRTNPLKLDPPRPTDDSGVGESVEGMSAVSSGGLSNPYKAPTTVRFEGEDNNDLEVADLEELEDTVHPLPGDAEYLRRKAMGAHFLAGVTPQQVATLSPQLKASMENFMNQLQQYVSCQRPNQPSRRSDSCRARACGSPQSLGQGRLSNAKANRDCSSLLLNLLLQ